MPSTSFIHSRKNINYVNLWLKRLTQIRFSSNLEDTSNDTGRYLAWYLLSSTLSRWTAGKSNIHVNITVANGIHFSQTTVHFGHSWTCTTGNIAGKTLIGVIFCSKIKRDYRNVLKCTPEGCQRREDPRVVEESRERERKSWVEDLKRGVLSSRRQSWLAGTLCVTWYGEDRWRSAMVVL